MDLSPNDIRNYEFPNQMRGYDKDEVDSLLDQVAAALEQAKQESLKLSMEVESLKSQLAGLKQFEDTIKSAAIDARRNADMTIQTAKQEAEMMLSKARSEADEVVSTRSKEASDIENQIAKLGLTKKSYLSKIRSMIQSHLEMIEEVAESVPEGHKPDELNITESTDVTSEQMETVANQPPSQPEEQEEQEPATEMSYDDDDDEPVDSDAEDLMQAIRDSESQSAEASQPESEPEPEPEPAPIDPELAAALENYKKTAAEDQVEQSDPAPAATGEIPVPSAPPVIETTARAEDIPPGFIAKEADLPEEQVTDRVKVPDSAEPNAIAMDDQPPSDKAPLEPDKLADELDQVAAKFEEEISRAEQN